MPGLINLVRGFTKTISRFFWNHRRNFAARGRHSWLWPKATTSLKSQDPLFAAGGRHDCLWPKARRFLMSYMCELVFGQPLLVTGIKESNALWFWMSSLWMTKEAIQILRNTSEIWRTLWPLATGNYGGLQPQIGGPVTSMMLWPLARTNCGGPR